MNEVSAPDRLVYVIDSMGTGGAETLVVDLALGARARGWDVEIVSLWNADGLPSNRAKAAGLELSTIGTSRVPTPLGWFRLWQICRGASIVHAHLFPASYVVALLPGKFHRIYTEHSNTNRRRRSRILRAIDDVVLQRYEKIVCVSVDSARAISSALGPAIRRRVTTINNGIRPDFFRTDKCAWPESGPIRILSVGRLIPSKNFHAVVKLLPNIADAEVTLVGHGPERDNLLQLSRHLGVLERFSILDPTEHLPQIMAEHDVFIHPSLSEGFGLVVLEAMASRLPILVADIPGIRSFAENGRTAVMFAPDDLGSLQSGFETLLADAAVRQQMVQSALRTARRFTVEAASSSYGMAYDEMLSRPRISGA